MPYFKVTELESLPAAIREQAEKVALQSHQMILVIGLEKENLTLFKDMPRLVASEWLCQKLLPIAMKRRPDEVEGLLTQLINEQKCEPVLLDRIHVLFDASLKLDVLRCLKEMSKHRILIINWPGSFNGAALSFSSPGKPDYFYYSETDLNSVPVLWFTGNGERK